MRASYVPAWGPPLSWPLVTTAVGEDAFRAVMASVCTPVTVVTTVDGDQPHGSTVSAFASLSLRPPLVLVALDRSSVLLRLIRRSGRFGVNVLAAGQADVATRFARKDSDRFATTGWALADGLPRLTGTASWLACEVAQVVDGGDHIIALGQVFGAGEGTDAEPLTYHRRRFGRHLPAA